MPISRICRPAFLRVFLGIYQPPAPLILPRLARLSIILLTTPSSCCCFQYKLPIEHLQNNPSFCAAALTFMQIYNHYLWSDFRRMRGHWRKMSVCFNSPFRPTPNLISGEMPIHQTWPNDSHEREVTWLRLMLILPEPSSVSVPWSNGDVVFIKCPGAYYNAYNSHNMYLEWPKPLYRCLLNNRTGNKS